MTGALFCPLYDSGFAPSALSLRLNKNNDHVSCFGEIRRLKLIFRKQ